MAMETITKATALDRKWRAVNGRGDTPNQHDILTGSLPDGTFAEATYANWTHMAKARPLSAITTAWVWTTPPSQIVEFVAPRRAAADRRLCTGPAATACSTASPNNNAEPARE